MPRRLGRTAALALLLLVLAATAACFVGNRVLHGRVIPGAYVPNHDDDFDFSQPPCAAAARPASEAGDVLIRYLGVGGLYVEWRGTAILGAPFFSRHGVWRAFAGRAGWDEQAVAAGLAGIPLERVHAVLVGHSHYDHVGDLPPLLLRHAVGADAYVNRSGAHLLAAFPELRPRLVVMNERLNEWIRLRDRDGQPLPLRLMALRSGHAPHLGCYHYAAGRVDRAWESWHGRKLRGMKEGLPLAFVVDLLADDDTVAFRIHYQDAAAPAPLGFPPAELIDRRPVDLAVLCMPSSWLVADYPQGLLASARAAHALVTHYEDFFRSPTKPLRFVTLLTNRRATAFMERVRLEMQLPQHRPRGPQAGVCGPSGDAWSMPLPGEWLLFRAILPH